MVENKAGKLADVANFLAKNGINLRALSLADTQNYGILRVIVENCEEAEALLKGAGYVVTVTQVLAVKVTDRPGGFAESMNKLASVGVGVEYAYAFTSSETGKAYIVLRVDDIVKAENALGDKENTWKI